MPKPTTPPARSPRPAPPARPTIDFNLERQAMLRRVYVINEMRRAVGEPTERAPAARPRNDATLSDALARALKGRVLSAGQAAARVIKAGYKTNSVSFRASVTAALNRDRKRFKRVSRGKYTLRAVTATKKRPPARRKVRRRSPARS